MAQPYGGWHAISPFVRLSVCPTPLAQNGAVWGYGYHGTLTGTPMLEVESTAQRGCTIIGSGQNGNETVAGKTAFARALNRCAYNYSRSIR